MLMTDVPVEHAIQPLRLHADDDDGDDDDDDDYAAL